MRRRNNLNSPILVKPWHDLRTRFLLPVPVERQCPKCGEEFKTVKRMQKYCDKCRGAK